MSEYLEEDNRRFYIYKMYDENEELLYIGKTTNIRNRIKQHFSRDIIEKQPWKEDVFRVEYFELYTKVDMDIAELYLIATERPKYNESSTDTTFPKSKLNIMYKGDKPENKNKISFGEKMKDIKIDKDIKTKISNNLNIYHGKLNNIGNYNSKDETCETLKYPLTISWFLNSEENLKQLKNNTVNYFRNIIKGKSKYNCWTTYEAYEDDLKGKGYIKGFVNCDCELSKLNNCKNFAYLMNEYPNITKMKKNKYDDLLSIYDLIRIVKYITIDLDHKLNLYVPSKRVRTLFEEWLYGEKLDNKHKIKYKTNFNEYINLIINKPLNKLEQNKLIQRINLENDDSKNKKGYDYVNDYLKSYYNLNLNKKKIFRNNKAETLWIIQKNIN